MTHTAKARPVGWTATINAPRGSHLTKTAIIAAQKRIASAYGLPATSIVIEPWPDGSEHKARLLVIAGDNPLMRVQGYPTDPPLDHTTGRLTVGAHATGADATWQLRIPDSGACHGLIAGTTGAGKSGLVNGLCVAVHTSDRDVLWLADTQGGLSAPAWVDAAGRFAGDVEQIRRMVAGLIGAMEYRQGFQRTAEWVDRNGKTRRGMGYFNPTPDYPQLNAIFEESPAALADEYIQWGVGELVRKARKVGIGVNLVTQYPSIKELGGGDSALRSLASSMNSACFRTGDRYSGNMASAVGYPIDPSELPKFWPDGSPTAGLGFLAAAGSGVSYMRAWYVEDPYEYADLPAGCALDEGTRLAAEAAVEVYDRGQAEAAALAAEKAAKKDGTPAPNPRLDATPDPALKNPDRVRKVLLEAEGPLTTGVIAARAGIKLARASETLARMRDAESVGAAQWRIAA